MLLLNGATEVIMSEFYPGQNWYEEYGTPGYGLYDDPGYMPAYDNVYDFDAYRDRQRSGQSERPDWPEKDAGPDAGGRPVSAPVKPDKTAAPAEIQTPRPAMPSHPQTTEWNGYTFQRKDLGQALRKRDSGKSLFLLIADNYPSRNLHPAQRNLRAHAVYDPKTRDIVYDEPSNIPPSQWRPVVRNRPDTDPVTPDGLRAEHEPAPAPAAEPAVQQPGAPATDPSGPDSDIRRVAVEPSGPGPDPEKPSRPAATPEGPAETETSQKTIAPDEPATPEKNDDARISEVQPAPDVRDDIPIWKRYGLPERISFNRDDPDAGVRYVEQLSALIFEELFGKEPDKGAKRPKKKQS
jgi:hypothetical protein